MVMMNMKKNNKEVKKLLNTLNFSIKKEIFVFVLLKVLIVNITIVEIYLFRFLIDNVLINRQQEDFLYICIGYFLVFIIQTFLVIVLRRKEINYYSSIQEKLQSYLWKLYINQDCIFYKKNNTGDIKNIIENDSCKIVEYIKRQLIDKIINIFTIIMLAATLLSHNIVLAIFSFCMVPISFWITSLLGKKQKRISKQYRDNFSEYEGWLYRVLGCWKDVKYNNCDSLVLDKFNERWDKISELMIKKTLINFGNSILHSFKDFFVTKMNIYFFGGLLILSGRCSIGILIAFINTFDKFFEAIQQINSINLEYTEIVPGIERIFSLEKECNKNENNLEKIQNIENIKYEDVSFGYLNGKEVLSNVNLEIKNNGFITVIGESGCGKSSMLKLLARLETPSKGTILINNKSIEDYYINSLYENMCYISQDCTLLNMSKIYSVCKKINFYSEIMAFADDFNKLIGVNGSLLSGGQRQKLLIAKALLSKAHVYVFDESTSAIDGESVEEIISIIKEIAKHSIVLMITHRKSIALQSDRILFVSKEQIIYDGQPEYISQTMEFKKLFNESNGFIGK